MQGNKTDSKASSTTHCLGSKIKLNFALSFLVGVGYHFSLCTWAEFAGWDFYLGTTLNRNSVCQGPSVSCYKTHRLLYHKLIYRFPPSIPVRPDQSRAPGEHPTMLEKVDAYLGLSLAGKNIGPGSLSYQPEEG